MTNIFEPAVDVMKLVLCSDNIFFHHLSLSYCLQCEPGYVIGIQLLNPIHNRSTEDIVIYDARTVNISVNAWNLRRDLVVFPTISSSYGVVMQYRSGNSALGGAVLVVSTVPGNQNNMYFTFIIFSHILGFYIVQ